MAHPFQDVMAHLQLLGTGQSTISNSEAIELLTEGLREVAAVCETLHCVGDGDDGFNRAEESEYANAEYLHDAIRRLLPPLLP